MALDNDIYSALNVSSVTSLLDTYKTSPALFNDVIMPQAFTGKKSINFYPVGTLNGALEYILRLYVANCRGETYSKSNAIADAVKAAVNRVSYSNYYLIADILPTIGPADDTDVYNTPVEITIKKRG